MGICFHSQNKKLRLTGEGRWLCRSLGEPAPRKTSKLRLRRSVKPGSVRTTRSSRLGWATPRYRCSLRRLPSPLRKNLIKTWINDTPPDSHIHRRPQKKKRKINDYNHNENVLNHLYRPFRRLGKAGRACLPVNVRLRSLLRTAV